MLNRKRSTRFDQDVGVRVTSAAASESHFLLPTFHFASCSISTSITGSFATSRATAVRRRSGTLGSAESVGDGALDARGSVQNLAGKLVFSVSLFVAAGAASDVATLPYADIRQILGWYVVAGLVIWTGLALTARRAGVTPKEGLPPA